MQTPKRVMVQAYLPRSPKRFSARNYEHRESPFLILMTSPLVCSFYRHKTAHLLTISKVVSSSSRYSSKLVSHGHKQKRYVGVILLLIFLFLAPAPVQQRPVSRRCFLCAPLN